MFWAGAELIAEFRQGLFLEVVGEDLEQRAANEGQIGQQIGVARARAIFSHQYVAAPMIADFDPAPVSLNQGQPLLGPMLLGWRTGQVIP